MADFNYKKTVRKMREVINADKPLAQSMATLLSFCKAEAPDEAALWKDLRSRDFDADAQKIARMFKASLKSKPVPGKYNGMYFGLDGLNMRDGKGIEFGCSKAFDESNDDGGSKWAYESEFYPFQIPSALLSALYNDVVEMGSLADYLVCIAYTGLAVRDTFRDLPVNLTLGRAKSRAICFGPHDGDLFRLGTLRADGLDLKCK
ncbi:MAG TPA: hypothetical protein VFW23_03260 [Tepidisphaeraceae bacterium]|nr:hypothetical protein [Tepidisphaeraceae bacterium]